MSAHLSDVDREWLRRSCAESGVPETVTDPDVVARAASVLGDAHESGGAR